MKLLKSCAFRAFQFEKLCEHCQLAFLQLGQSSQKCLLFLILVYNSLFAFILCSFAFLAPIGRSLTRSVCTGAAEDAVHNRLCTVILFEDNKFPLTCLISGKILENFEAFQNVKFGDSGCVKTSSARYTSDPNTFDLYQSIVQTIQSPARIYSSSMGLHANSLN